MELGGKIKIKHILATVAVAAVSIIVRSDIHSSTKHIGPDYLYPNPTLTPGLEATTDFKELSTTNSCGTYSECHRQTPEALKAQIRKEYPTCPAEQEIDHLIPLALGGADDAKNLWCQPKQNVWNGIDYGYPTKDKLESYLVIEMKAGKITPNDAQNCILNDWVNCYEYFFTKSGPRFNN